MNVESLIELASKYARYNFHKEEKIVFEEFVKFETKLTYDEYITWFKSNFENYFSIICIMWKGDEKRIETQIKDDYLTLCRFYDKTKSTKIDKNLEKKLELKDIISFAIYFCEYRIQHITYDCIIQNKSLDEKEKDLKFFKDKKAKWTIIYDNVIKSCS